MKIIIVDDELSPRENLKSLLSKFYPSYCVCAEAEDTDSAREKILIHRPDLVFLDVDLHDGNAFELLHKFREINFSVIFVTAHEQYALKAIKFSALDFLLKPFTTNEFIEAMQKAEHVKLQDEMKLSFATFFQNIQSNNNPTRIVLRTQDSIHVVPVEEIIRLQADGAYTTFHTINRKPIVVSKNLKEYESLLENNGFIRTHQSHLVNSRFIVCFIKTDGGSLCLSNSTQIPVASRYKEKVLNEIARI